MLRLVKVLSIEQEIQASQLLNRLKENQTCKPVKCTLNAVKGNRISREVGGLEVAYII